jgi:hypothetical protein
MNLNGAPRKTMTYKERERNAEIDRENRRLHGNLNNIYTAPPAKSFVSEMALDTNTRIAAGLDDNGPSLVEKGRAARRQQELLEVILQNQAIHGRLSSVHAVMDRRDFSRHADKHEENVRRRAKMPFVLRDDEWDDDEEGYEEEYLDDQPRQQQQQQQRRQQQPQRYEQQPPQRRARSTMEMSQSREITGISALDEETSHLQQSRGRGGGGRGGGGGGRSRSQNSSWNEGPAERARRELEGEQEDDYYYGGDGEVVEEDDGGGAYAADDRDRGGGGRERGDRGRGGGGGGGAAAAARDDDGGAEMVVEEEVVA